MENHNGIHTTGVEGTFSLFVVATRCVKIRPSRTVVLIMGCSVNEVNLEKISSQHLGIKEK